MFERNIEIAIHMRDLKKNALRKKAKIPSVKRDSCQVCCGSQRRVKEDSPVSFAEVSSVINKREAPGWSEKTLFNV